ncbi:flavodoxin domain-containing protein [Methanocella arvoryzae]|uniref:Predicted flavodoxin-like protein n=1 Tax=Methanocella arvoryzae (strain DSM 22066 / NBRC 105507 / MRE50) TaxID=351160 RepID=Q0W7Q5_METAR|nr:flavodoxin domain-containing protein [Methanocella arvoryzae]CAJ35588.1 predicted flavodoxin-like protein [Methanocella arvoryzae MRE50]
MAQFLIVCHSTTGNTRALAEAIKDRAQSLHVDAELADAFDVKPEDILTAAAVGFGVPTFNYHPARPITHLIDSLCIQDCSGKIAVVFGSYGWSGQGPIMVAEKLRALGFKVLDPVIRVKYQPSENEIDGCKLLGRDVAAMLKRIRRTVDLNA